MRLAVHWAGVAGHPVVVLLHGLFGSARNLGGLRRALAGSFQVAAIDLRNHGDSPHGEGMAYAAMTDDVRQTLQSEGVTSACVVGHSMGGKVAMTLALHAPAMVERLVVADIAPVTYPSHFGAYVAAMLTVRATSSRAQADAALAGAIPDAAIRSFLLHNFRSGTGWRIGLDEIAAALPEVEIWDSTDATPFARPTLFVTGARSDYVKAGDRPAITALFPAASFAEIPDAGHWLHAEQPDAFNRRVAAFLSAA